MKEIDEIPLSKPTVLGSEQAFIADAISGGMLSGGQKYTCLCESVIRQHCGAGSVLLMPSGTHALEASALLCAMKPGDEVIMPSFTFSSTANAFALRGASIRFVDIRPDTQNIDENLIEAAITPRTRAIVPVHYAGVSCEMNRIMEIARAYRLTVVEDAAQGYGAAYQGRALGTIGDYGCYSFHATKNLTMGEGGALLMRDEENALRALILRDKGTNRAQFLRGMVDRYTWVGLGSSLLVSELSAAYLYAQVTQAEAITARRLRLWRRYREQLAALAQRERITLPVVPQECTHNAHIFYIKTASGDEQAALRRFLAVRGVESAFHYSPLHSAPQGIRSGSFVGKDRYTTDTFERLLRLPLYHGMTAEQVDRVCMCMEEFYHRKGAVQ